MSLSKLQAALKSKLEGARFRWINEELYTRTGAESLAAMTADPSAFHAYHAGYRLQVEGWPENPLDRIIAEIRSGPPTAVVADMGCGEARLAASVPNRVHSFDLVAVNPTVTACDIAHVPLPDASVDVVVFCLSLMGTNYGDFLAEANRILRPGGRLLIAEVRSRFETASGGAAVGGKRRRPGEGGGGGGGSGASGSGGGDGIATFIGSVQALGFKSLRRDTANPVFVLLYFGKPGHARSHPPAAGGIRDSEGGSGAPSAKRARKGDGPTTEDGAAVGPDSRDAEVGPPMLSKSARRRANRKARLAAAGAGDAGAGGGASDDGSAADGDESAGVAAELPGGSASLPEPAVSPPGADRHRGRHSRRGGPAMDAAARAGTADGSAAAAGGGLKPCLYKRR
jgi:ribosomal RNA-processing protein 8